MLKKICALCTLLLLCGCGLKGPLYLDEPKPEKSSEQTQPEEPAKDEQEK
ncbi:LPS translocon maturation chaperone LptM [Thalassotalea agarivorans]|nr:lipoprotein [Thalassotalea agarivorans]